ncbi:flavin-containing monooxygenase [Thalassobius sp. S69A]|uniref:flavin-containing monooxygenase n=1 Tax=unclassified Thalassovita TaxID=2619711 RepID=UPI000C0E922D|nr:4-hydroxyacetophenone monooxygenase [Paracoccaceae bacterium]MBT26922.1 4-hydroxyacetophenone monooxygenase [Paracoccaceae bacterium]
MTDNSIIHETSIIIVGAGFGGLGMAMKLKEHGMDDFVILERAEDVGGAWRDNTYPGVACDVPSHLYSFSYMPKPDWSRVFSPGGEIWDYLRDCASKSGLVPHIHFGANLEKASWDEQTNLWTVETPLGTWRARFLITATGVLADAVLPDIPGMDGFTGAAFHSSKWDHSVCLEGKRVGIVGSGASAIQIVPELTKLAKELVVFQRSAPYIIPRPDRAYTDAEKRTFARLPETMENLREDIFWFGESMFAQRRNVPTAVAEARTMALSHLADQVPNETLRAGLTPDYEIGCKRVLIANTYYPSFNEDHVTLETSALASVDVGTAKAVSGNAYDLDVLVFATGFEAPEPPVAHLVHGKGGKRLVDQWDRGMQAYDSTAIPGFPNMFMVLGPNTGLGHHTMVFMIEAQVDYILGALDFMQQKGLDVLEAKPEAEAEYLEGIDARAQGTVWVEGGCKFWYRDPRSDRLTVLWPDFAYAFRDENGTFHPEGYTGTPATTAAE